MKTATVLVLASLLDVAVFGSSALFYDGITGQNQCHIRAQRTRFSGWGGHQYPPSTPGGGKHFLMLVRTGSYHIK
jgi:hypothetical protein